MKLLLYCTKAKPYLSLYEEGYGEEIKLLYGTTNNKTLLKQLGVGNSLNGKIVAECDFEVEEIEYSLIVANNKPYHYYEPQNTFVDKFYEKSCLNHQQVEEYLGYKNGYAIHIKNLHIFDEPKELDYYYSRPKKVNTFDWYGSKGYTYINITLDKAPQNMMYCCTESGREYILISIHPEWLCKILNGEKTIEVRKKVLKEMLKNDKRRI